MKKVIYLDISRSGEDNLGSLSESLNALLKHKTLSSFIGQELGKRRDDVLWDKDISPEEKIGHLKQIISFGDLLLGNGLNTVNKAIKSKAQNNDSNVKEDKTVNPEFKRKVTS